MFCLASDSRRDRKVIIKESLDAELWGRLCCFDFLSLLEEKYWK